MDYSLYINWDEHNDTGVPIIDDQHKGIVSTINSLYHFMRGGHGEDILQPTLEILRLYTIVHFRTEERLMIASGYPDIDGHVKIHDGLSRKMKKIAMDQSVSPDIINVLNFLREWWLTHINHEDRKYISYMLRLAKV
jgi:hemerythrin-like metal-binding protein